MQENTAKEYTINDAIESAVSSLDGLADAILLEDLASALEGLSAADAAQSEAGGKSDSVPETDAQIDAKDVLYEAYESIGLLESQLEEWLSEVQEVQAMAQKVPSIAARIEQEYAAAIARHEAHVAMQEGM